MEGPYLPEGSGGEEPPEGLSWDDLNERALQQYEQRLLQFELGLNNIGKRQRRRSLLDYITKNCEEARGQREGGAS